MNDTKAQKTDKTVTGNYFEDFKLGQEIVHATPRTVTEGDRAPRTAEKASLRTPGWLEGSSLKTKLD